MLIIRNNHNVSPPQKKRRIKTKTKTKQNTKKKQPTKAN